MLSPTTTRLGDWLNELFLVDQDVRLQPGAWWLRLDLAAWFAATLAQQRRHLAQANRVREAAGFPSRGGAPGAQSSPR